MPEPTTTFRIVTNGIDMGTYEATDEDEALDKYARDEGYIDFDDLLQTVPRTSREEINVEEEA